MKGFSNEGSDLGRNRIWKPKIQNELVYTIKNIKSVVKNHANSTTNFYD